MKRPFARLLALTGSILIGTAGALVLASPAQAHHTTVTPTANCTEDGWNISWKVDNGEWDHGKSGKATITKMEVTPGDAAISGFGVGTKIAKNSSVTGTQFLPSSQSFAKVKIWATWDNGKKNDNYGDIELDWNDCGKYEAGIEAVGECNTDTGNWNVTWKVSNKHFGKDAKATVITGSDPKSAIEVGGSWQTINENVIVGLKDNDKIAKSSTTTATQVVPGAATAARLSVELKWEKNRWKTTTDRVTDTVRFTGKCAKAVPLPEVDFASDCSKTVTVTLKNKDTATKDAIFTITFNGVSTQYTVAPGKSEAISINGADTGAIQVTAAEGMDPKSYTWQDSVDCHPLEYKVDASCRGLSITVNNPQGGKESTFVLTPNVGDGVTKTLKPGESATVEYAQNSTGPLYVDVTIDGKLKERVTWEAPWACDDLEADVKNTCTGVTVDILNPTDGTTKDIVLTPSSGEKATFTLLPGESKHLEFAAPGKGGLTIDATVNGELQGTFTWEKPKDCPKPPDLPKTGDNTSGFILWGSILVAVGGLAVYMARRRLVHLRNLAR